MFCIVLQKLSCIDNNILEEIRNLTADDIGQNLGTLGRHMEHLAEIGQTLGRNWEDIGQIIQFPHEIKDFWILSCNIRLFGFLIQDKTFRLSFPRFSYPQ